MNSLMLSNVKCTGYSDVAVASNGKKYIKFDALDESSKSIFNLTIWEESPAFKNCSEHRIIRNGDYYSISGEIVMRLQKIKGEPVPVPYISVSKVEWLRSIKKQEKAADESKPKKVVGFGM